MGGEGWMAKTSIFRKGNRLHSEKIKHMGPVLRQKGEVWAKLATEVTFAGLFIARGWDCCIYGLSGICCVWDVILNPCSPNTGGTRGRGH